ncbi:H(+)/Cl(-) exchange transporter 7 [Biomphalaria pfeifferi]|uniref:H(+)/Cl(-) exchange transporter 7 n=1 Tax=Biomphalaria pfeifferi TaxID=112525 RepID=A0AAD8C1T1_BIOPF|nr:H(+)/Cl(-) exchange transporter 7 [Biomphalaria pfeifferi]
MRQQLIIIIATDRPERLKQIQLDVKTVSLYFLSYKLFGVNLILIQHFLDVANMQNKYWQVFLQTRDAQCGRDPLLLNNLYQHEKESHKEASICSFIAKHSLPLSIVPHLVVLAHLA